MKKHPFMTDFQSYKFLPFKKILACGDFFDGPPLHISHNLHHFLCFLNGFFLH